MCHVYVILVLTEGEMRYLLVSLLWVMGRCALAGLWSGVETDAKD